MFISIVSLKDTSIITGRKKERKVLTFPFLLKSELIQLETNILTNKSKKKSNIISFASLFSIQLKRKKNSHLFKSPCEDNKTKQKEKNKKKQFNQPSTNSRLKRCLIMLAFFTYLYHIAMALMCIFFPLSLHQKFNADNKLQIKKNLISFLSFRFINYAINGIHLTNHIKEIHF